MEILAKYYTNIYANTLCYNSPCRQHMTPSRHDTDNQLQWYTRSVYNALKHRNFFLPIELPELSGPLSCRIPEPPKSVCP